jgi:putative transcriptional regulator
MSLAHHPSEATLMAYAAGGLDEGLSLVVAVHLGVCPLCRETVVICEAVGGQMLALSKGADMAEDALSQALGRLDTLLPALTAPPPQPPARLGFDLPHALQGYHLRSWRWVAPGIRQIRVLPRRAGRSGLNLLRVSPGVAVPCHAHGGLELSCILTGSYVDETGHFRTGDLAEMDGDVDHMPIADRNDGCICMIASDAPLKFRSLLPRLLRPVLGF